MKKISFLIFIIVITLIACADNPKVKEIEFSNYHKSEDHQHRKDSIPVIYVAVSTMISPMETFNLYKDVMDYISKHLGIQIEFKQRKTYREVNDLLAENKLDFAFICTGAYLEARNEIPIEILAVPVVNGKPYYQAYVIANEESQISEINQLKGKSFAFTDPLSNTGYSYIINYLKEKNTSPERFFSKTIFTYAHDYSIQAVKRKIVDGATVDGLVFEYLKHFQPEKIAGVKVILKSREFGIPPFVIQKNLDNNIKQKLRSVMLNMHNDPEGKKLLSKIMIDKFILADDSIYR
ncbi:phosphate/phosphite/phosphonate ABC transporter substrate-binding protein [Ignavibacterium album]|uniref:substrate-binding domain-containing protein n=1 Tax=Ignavibacterium album TaxID=591197 RepID=UPI0035BA544A